MTQQRNASKPRKKQANAEGSQRMLGLCFGVVFGFLLQKGGVGQYDILVGALLLRDFTVFQVILTAILVGMVGVFTLHRFGLVELHVKPMSWGSNVIGGLIFGLGFGSSGYCPGTGAVAVAQGNYDACVTIIGLLVGSYVYAEMSGFLGRTVATWGDRGKLMLSDVVPAPRAAVIVVVATLIVVALVMLDRLSKLGAGT